MRSGCHSAAEVVALGLQRLVVGGDVNSLVQVNTLLQADSILSKLYMDYQSGFPTPTHVGSDSRTTVFIILKCAFCVCSSGMRV